MKLAHFALETPISWSGDKVCTLVLENNKFFRDAVLQLVDEANGGTGNFVLSENNEILPFEKTAEIITDVFSLDAALNKSVVTGLQKDVAQYAQFEMQEELSDVFAKINGVLSKLSCETELDVAFDDVNDVTAY